MARQTIRITEDQLRRIVTESVENILNGNSIQTDNPPYGELDEGIGGMIFGATVGDALIQKVVDWLANMLKLDKNGVLYRTLSSKLFATALFNEIQNARRLKKANGKQNALGTGNGMQGIGNGSLMQMLGIGSGNGGMLSLNA